MSELILLCGVPGSGKTWVMNQLRDKYSCIDNDDYIGLRPYMFLEAMKCCQKRKMVVLDCPFDERETRVTLQANGITVIPIFIIESPKVVAERYRTREGKPASKATITRATTIMNRCEEWGAKYGTSDEVLKYLLKMVE